MRKPKILQEEDQPSLNHLVTLREEAIGRVKVLTWSSLLKSSSALDYHCQISFLKFDFLIFLVLCGIFLGGRWYIFLIWFGLKTLWLRTSNEEKRLVAKAKCVLKWGFSDPKFTWNHHSVEISWFFCYSNSTWNLF